MLSPVDSFFVELCKGYCMLQSGDGECTRKDMDISKNEHSITIEMSNLKTLMNVSLLE